MGVNPCQAETTLVLNDMSDIPIPKRSNCFLRFSIFNKNTGIALLLYIAIKTTLFNVKGC